MKGGNRGKESEDGGREGAGTQQSKQTHKEMWDDPGPCFGILASVETS